MQYRKRKYLGLTVMQLIVLACLGLTTFGVIGIAARIILGKSMPLDTIAVQPTSMPISTRTPLSTRTPIPPTPTFTATTYESLIPNGWIQQKYENVEFWVPVDFEKDPSSEDLVGLANKIPGTKSIPASVSLSNEIGIKTDLDTFVQEGVKQFTRDVTYLESKKFEIGIYEVKRLKLEVIVSNIPLENVLYFIKDGDTVWIISGFSHLEDFHDWLPIFDQIARTFRITPGSEFHP
jgi:hypothetical protein